MIISQNFISSQWCLWELHLAQHSLLEEKRDGIILIVVEKVKLSDLPPTLRFLMKTRIYLEWDSEPTKQDLFWTRLRSALASTKRSTHSLTSTSNETIEVNWLFRYYWVVCCQMFRMQPQSAVQLYMSRSLYKIWSASVLSIQYY